MCQLLPRHSPSQSHNHTRDASCPSCSFVFGALAPITRSAMRPPCTSFFSIGCGATSTHARNDSLRSSVQRRWISKGPSGSERSNWRRFRPFPRCTFTSQPTSRSAGGLRSSRHSSQRMLALSQSYLCRKFRYYLAFGELTLLPPPGATVVLQNRVSHSATFDLLIDNSFMTFTFNEPLPSPLSLG